MEQQLFGYFTVDQSNAWQFSSVNNRIELSQKLYISIAVHVSIVYCGSSGQLLIQILLKIVSISEFISPDHIGGSSCHMWQNVDTSGRPLLNSIRLLSSSLQERQSLEYMLSCAPVLQTLEPSGRVCREVFSGNFFIAIEGSYVISQGSSKVIQRPNPTMPLTMPLTITGSQSWSDALATSTGYAGRRPLPWLACNVARASIHTG